ncbi:hypothetical protein ACVWZA_002044 [Sphingomonas sp. UYAg733]
MLINFADLDLMGDDRAEDDQAPHGGLVSLSLGEFLQMDFPRREMLLAPWLPAKGLAMVFAPRGVGKTHFALGVAHAIATGGRFLRWQAPAARPVLLLDGEMPAVALQERLARITENDQSGGMADGGLRVLASDLCPFGIPDLSTPVGQRQIEPVIRDAELIVVDNLSTICRSGRENEAESWASVQNWALAQRRAGRSVLFVHHAGKGGEQRGTSRREDVMDSVVRLSRPDDYLATDGARFVVTFTKNRGFTGADAAPFEAGFSDNQWTMRDIADIRGADGNGLQDEIIDLIGNGLSQRQVAAELGVSPGTVNRLVKKARRENGEVDGDGAT